MELFDKTMRGREEISTRKHGLSPRLRILLLLVDGKTQSAALLEKTSGLGFTHQNLLELEAAGLVQQRADTETATPEHSVIPDGTTQFEAIYQFYMGTIPQMLGMLHAYSLQLKVERALSITDFQNLRTSYLDAVLKSKGPEITNALRHRLDQLLFMHELPADTDT